MNKIIAFTFKMTADGLCSVMPGTEKKGSNGGKAVLIHKSIIHNVQHGERWACEVLAEQRNYVLVKPISREEEIFIAPSLGRDGTYFMRGVSGDAVFVMKWKIPEDAIEKLTRYSFDEDGVKEFIRFKYEDHVSSNHEPIATHSPDAFKEMIRSGKVDLPKGMITSFKQNYYPLNWDHEDL